MNTSACLSDTSLLVLTLQFRINTARIKALLIFPWVLTPYYLLSNSGPHHLLAYPSGSWFRYHFRLWTLSFELYWNLVDSSPVQYLKAFPIQPQSLNSSWFSYLSHCSASLPGFPSGLWYNPEAFSWTPSASPFCPFCLFINSIKCELLLFLWQVSHSLSPLHVENVDFKL